MNAPIHNSFDFLLFGYFKYCTFALLVGMFTANKHSRDVGYGSSAHQGPSEPGSGNHLTSRNCSLKIIVKWLNKENIISRLL